MPGMMRLGMVRRMHGGAAAAPFSPPDVSGLWTWLKADAITGLVDGDPVTTWEDAHTSNRDATQATAAKKPTYKTGILNSLSVVRFDGTDDYFGLPDISALTAATVFVVIKVDADAPPTAGQTGLWKFDSTTASGDASHFPWTDGTVYDKFGSTARKTTGNPAASLSSTFRIYTVLTKANEWTSWVDETQHFTTATNTVQFSTTPHLGHSQGNPGFEEYYLDGDIAEFILYDSDIGSTNRQSVWDHLQAKYAL
jgi:hypothetical protein